MAGILFCIALILILNDNPNAWWINAIGVALLFIVSLLTNKNQNV